MGTVRIVFDMTSPSFSGKSSFCGTLMHVWAQCEGALHIVRSVLFPVVRSSEKLKVFQSVIVPNPVDVMNVFFDKKAASVGAFPDDAMFFNVSSFSRCWMLWQVHTYIAFAGFVASAFPCIRVAVLAVVSRKSRVWVTLELAHTRARVARGLSLLTASALTKARWNFFRVRDIKWFSHAVDSLSVNGWSGSLGRRNLSCGPLVFYHALKLKGGT